MKTTLPKDPGVDRGWTIVDVNDKPLGRAAVVIANILRGKNRPGFSRFITITVVTGVDLKRRRHRLSGRDILTG
jgi:ribosomal protein L13